MSIPFCTEWACIALAADGAREALVPTQNSMLRKIAGPGRPEEQWVDWIKPSTRVARRSAEAAGIRMWLDHHLKAKWCWAGHVLRMNPDRLAIRATQCIDSVGWATVMELAASIRLHRPHRTRWFRWEDELRRYARKHGLESWQTLAQKRDSSGYASEWMRRCESFIRCRSEPFGAGLGAPSCALFKP